LRGLLQPLAELRTVRGPMLPEALAFADELGDSAQHADPSLGVSAAADPAPPPVPAAQRS